MARSASGQLVYSTDKGSVCARCGWPKSDCRCAANLEQPVPEKIVVRLRLEKSGRGGKSVTVIDSLPKNRDFLRALAGELKRACGTGGTIGDGCVEIQGDRREVLRPLLAARGFVVKG
ncbi:MAG: stress response translation initiation inhibitor YciH [Thermoanaerobaculia bacterium]